MMKEQVKKELERLQKVIENEENISYGELFFLESHKKEVLEIGDVRLCEFAGIPEEDYNFHNCLNEDVEVTRRELIELADIIYKAGKGLSGPIFYTHDVTLVEHIIHDLAFPCYALDDDCDEILEKYNHDQNL